MAAVFTGLLGLMVGLVLVYQAIRSPAPPPLRYDQAVYVPEVARLCPGDTLVYTNTLTVDIAGGIFSGASWFSGHGDAALSVVSLKMGDMDMRVFGRVPITITRRRTNIVPALPPGPVEMRFLATNFRSQDAMHRVEFWIKSNCPTGGR